MSLMRAIISISLIRIERVWNHCFFLRRHIRFIKPKWTIASVGRGRILLCLKRVWRRFVAINVFGFLDAIAHVRVRVCCRVMNPIGIIVGVVRVGTIIRIGTIVRRCKRVRARKAGVGKASARRGHGTMG
jgi:hypothetical protein